MPRKPRNSNDEGIKMICPDCKGKKKIVAAHVTYSDGSSGFDVPLDCFRCKKTGEVPDEQEEWMVLGRQMKEWRRSKQRTLREEASRRILRPTELSGMERGHIEPVLPPEMLEMNATH